MNIRVLMYHDVRDLHETQFPKRYLQRSFIRVQTFKEHLDYIQSKYKIISVEDLHRLFADLTTTNMKNNSMSEDPMIVLTFDDGVKDHLRVGQMLHERGLSGCFCIPVLPVVMGNIIPSHMIQFIIAEIAPNFNSVVDDILDFLCLDGVEREKYFQTFSRSRWKNNYWSAEEIFITNSLRSIESTSYEFIRFLFGKYVTQDIKSVAEDLYLNQKEVIQLHDMGMIIGGHGLSSVNLAKLLSQNAQEYEIYRVKSFLSDLRRVGFYFSYPNGEHTGTIRALMKKHGFDMAFVTGNLALSTLLENHVVPDIYSIPRIDASQHLFDLC